MGFTKDVLCLDPMSDKIKSFGWNVLDIDGHDIEQLLESFNDFKHTKGKPTMIIANTIKGKGVSYMENNLRFHYSAPNDEEFKIAMEELR